MKEFKPRTFLLLTISLVFVSITIVMYLFILGERRNHFPREIKFSSSAPPYQERILGEIIMADISRDGDLVSVIVRNQKTRISTLYVRSLKDNNWLKIADEVLNCAWGNDGVLWLDKKEGNTFWVYKWQRETLEAIPLLSKAFQPCPSPDGKWLVCSPYREREGHLELADNLIVYDLMNGKGERINFEKGYTPYFFEWADDSRRLYIFCLPPPAKFSPSEGFSLFLLKPTSFKPKLVVTKIYPRGWMGVSWCLKDGSVVFVRRELYLGEFPYSSKVPISAPPGFPSSPPRAPTYKFFKYNEQQGEKVIWQEKKYADLFAISDDGRFLLIPQENIDSEKRVYFSWKLIDLKNKKERILEKEEIKGCRRVWYHSGLGGFCIATRKGIFLLNRQGELKTMLTLEGILYESK